MAPGGKAGCSIGQFNKAEKRQLGKITHLTLTGCSYRLLFRSEFPFQNQRKVVEYVSIIRDKVDEEQRERKREKKRSC